MTLAVLLVAPAGPASAERAQDYLTCQDRKLDTQDARIRSCSVIIASDKTSPQVKAAAYDLRGNIFGAKGELSRAVIDYEAAIRLDPNYPHPYVNRGTVWDKRGDFDRAIADYNRAIELDPSYASAYHNRGVAFGHKGELARSIADFDRAIGLDPKSADTYYNRGLAWFRKGDMDRAIADYDQTLQLNPTRTLALNNRGVAYQKKGDLDHAIADFGAAIQSDPQNAGAYRNRSDAWERKGELDRAMADSSEAIRLAPQFFAAYFARGRLFLYAGNTPQAVSDLSRASELQPAYAYAALWLDIANRRGGRTSQLDEAATRLNMSKWPAPVVGLYLGKLTPEAVLAAADDPDPGTKQGQLCEANFYSAEFVLQQGAKDEAIRLLRQAATGCPGGFIESTAAKVELKALGVAL
jgi:lipoprotein NlpI